MMIAFIERFIIAFERLAAAQEEIARKTPAPWNYYTGGTNLQPIISIVPNNVPTTPTAGGGY